MASAHRAWIVPAAGPFGRGYFFFLEKLQGSEQMRGGGGARGPSGESRRGQDSGRVPAKEEGEDSR